MEGRGLCRDRLPNLMLTECFESTLIQIVSLRQDGCRWVLLEEHMLDFVVRQETRKREADTTSADDNHRDVNDLRVHCSARIGMIRDEQDYSLTALDMVRELVELVIWSMDII